jgi:hypothetical protein
MTGWGLGVVLSCKETFAHGMRRRCCSEDWKSIASNRPALIALTTGMSVADAGQGPRLPQCPLLSAEIHPALREQWLVQFPLLRRLRGPCGPELRKAIKIDTPDPRYWIAYDNCIGL